MKISSSLLWKSCLASSLFALASAVMVFAADNRLPTLFVCGDSTAAPSRLPIQGWGEMVGEFFDAARTKIDNRALGGRSARTFIAEGRWEAVRSKLQAGDVVLLQFGHNDTKSAISSDRYDLSGLGDEVEETTNPRTGEKIQIRTFGYYMTKMVDEGLAAGAKVIVLSSVPRSKWVGGKIVRGEENHGPWAAAVAKARGVPFVDVNGLIADVYDPIGRPRIKALYFPSDNTHTNPAGARVNAACVVQGLLALKDAALAALVKDNGAALAAEVIAGVPKAAAAVKLPVPVAAAFPAANATNVCPDTPLRLTFPAAVALGAAGKIEIHDAADNSVVERIDISSPVATKSIGGLPNYNYYTVIVSSVGSGIDARGEATLFPKNGALAYNKTYYVTIDAGVFKDGTDTYAALDQPTAWRFTTKSAPPLRPKPAERAPAPGSTKLTVAADGTGDFCTVQGALDFIPDGNTTPTTISLRRGLYTEMVFVMNKHAITLLGEDRKECVIAYSNNDRFNNNSGGNPFGSASPNPAAAPRVGGAIYRRGMLLAQRCNDLTIANLTLRNTTPQGGAQAEAIILNGTTTARAILKDVDLYSYQDTLQINGQAYLENCYIEGDVDFMWGTGPCFFEKCTLRTLRSGAYYTQIRNPPTNHGYVYAHCTFDGAQGIMGNYLSRVGPARFPASEVVLLDCVLTNAVGPHAWQWQGAGETSRIHFWEFNSHDADGQPTETSLRLAGSKQLTQPADAATIANYLNPTFVLGNDWNPKNAPIFSGALAAPKQSEGGPAIPAADGISVITVQPQSQLALLGTNPALTVVATGNAGRLTYQWRKNGRVIPGSTQPTLRIEGMKWDDAAVYTVTITNTAGAITSDAARLAAVAPQSAPATPPKLPVIPSATFDVTAHGAIGDGATDNTAAIQKTIDTAVAAGGGIVVIPAAPKPYLSGPITLGNAINLEIAFGATLQMLPHASDGKIPAFPVRNSGYLIGATGTPDARVHDIAITGGGTIFGDGDAWWAAFRADRTMPRRPWLVRLTGCERVLISGVTFMRSPMFHVAPGSTNDLTIFGITIRSPGGAPNTDGVDPSGSHHLIQNCDIFVGDDDVVMKPGGTFCSDITIADCLFGAGHGMSVGGQSNRGLDGMTVKNCYFNGTETGLRLKADPTQGGDVKNITYTNLDMRGVSFPIVFYSYYNRVGNPGTTSGNTQMTVEKVKTWNATPPNSLESRTLPSWKNITVSNLTSTGTKAWGIIYGLPLDGYFIDNVKLHNVRITGGPGLEIFDATNVQFTGDTDITPLLTCNTLVVTSQPQNQRIAAGITATFAVTTAGTSGVSETAPTFQWTFNGTPLADGKKEDGAVISGATTATLKIENAQSANAGKYAVTVSNNLDSYDVAAKALVPGKSPVSATSATATLTVGALPNP